MTELLSPAGNFEKLRAAIRFGADAVYLAGKQFGMRSAADNFTNEELDAAIDFVHANGKKLYLTLNTLPHGSQYPALRQFLQGLAHNPPDAVIVTDLGVFATVRELLEMAEEKKRRSEKENVERAVAREAAPALPDSAAAESAPVENEQASEDVAAEEHAPVEDAQDDKNDQE